MVEKYVVAVQLPGNSFWTIHSSAEGEELDRAKVRLADCVESYGRSHTAFFRRVYYNITVSAGLLDETNSS